MRYVRFSPAAVGRGTLDEVLSGVVEGDTVHELAHSAPERGGPESEARTGRSFALGEVRLRAPLVPRHVIGIGQNFVPEGETVPSAPAIPILFFKPITSVIGPDDAIVLPPGIAGAKFESELAVVIGRHARGITVEEALDYVFGYTVANDLAASEFHHPDGHWTISKSFDTFCPLGPAIVTELDLPAVRIEAFVNGTRMQDAGIDRMITGIAEMIAYVAGFMTLSPGDLLLTGTPAGAGLVRDGDVVECRIESIGRLRNPVRGATGAAA